MARSWKMCVISGLMCVPATLWAQLPPEPPSLASPPGKPTPVSPPAKTQLPDLPDSPSTLPPLPPGFESPTTTTGSDKPNVHPPSPPKPVSIGDKVDAQKPGSSSVPNNNHVLPPPTPEKPVPAPSTPSATGPVVPDISGMPGGHDAFQPASWPPSVPAPVAPMPVPTPPPPEHVGGPSGWVFFGDVLFWRPRLNEPQFLAVQNPNPVTFQVRLTPWDGDYEVAFRAGVGYLFSGGVYVWGEYTHYDNLVMQSNLSVPAVPSTFVLYNGPGVLHGQPVNSGESATSSWDLRYHTVDIMAGSVLSPTEFFDLLIAAGARLASITHRFDFTRNSGGGANLDRDHFQVDTEGAGPRFGGEGRLYLWRGHAGWSLAFYSRAYTSLLFADIDETEISQSFTGAVLTRDLQSHYSRRQILPQVELAVGGEWSLFGGRLIIAGGYEWVYWFDAASSNVSAAVSGNVQHQDLSFDGPFIRAFLLW